MNHLSSAKETSPMQVFSGWLWVGLFVLILDQLSKGLVYTYLPIIDSTSYLYPYGGIGIFQNMGGVEFSLNHMTNTGAAWGAFGNHQLLLIIVRMGLILGLCLYLFYFNHDSSWQLPLILIISGALGNVLDFFLYGHVVDMFHFVLWGYDFPIFNIADSAISIGIFTLFLFSCFKPTPS